MRYSTVPASRAETGQRATFFPPVRKKLACRDAFPSRKLSSLPPRKLPYAGRRADWEKFHSTSEPGRGGDPRKAGAPEQVRISPAQGAGRCAPVAPSGERQSGIHHPIEMPFTFWTRGVGGRRGCRGACPSHPLPLAGRRPNLDAGPYPLAGGRKNWRSLQSRPFDPSPGDDPTSMPGRIRQLAAEKIGATCRLGPLVPRREATQPRCQAVSAGRRQQK